MDGWVTIGFKGDTRQLEKDIKTEERKLKQFEREAKKLTEQKAKIEVDISNFEGAIKLIQKETDEVLKNAQTQEQVNEVLQQEADKLKEINMAYEISKEELDEINKKTAENTHQQNLTNGKIEEMKTKLAQTKGLGEIKNNIESIGNSVESVIKKVVRWGLAVFGVRSIYRLIRQSMSTLSQYDETLASNLEYIRYVLANMLKPIIDAIIQGVYKILVYIAYIAKAWFGVNIFANASAKAFKQASDGVKATNKNAKELQKTLAGFDEMNILQENGTTTSGGGGGGIAVPSIDLANWDNVQIPKWIQWIADNKDMILGFFDDLLKAILAFKIAKWVTGLLTAFGVLEGMSKLAIFGMLAGIAITLYGIFETIEAIIAFIKNPSWEKFNEIIRSLGTAVAGLGIVMIAFNATNPVGWILLCVGACTSLVGGFHGLATGITVASMAMIAFNATNPIGWIGLAVGAIVGIIGAFGDWASSSKETTERLKDTKQATDDLREAQEELANQTNTYTSAVKSAEKAQAELEEAEKKNKMSGEELYRSVQIGTVDYKNMTDAQREVFDAYVANLEAQEKLEDATNKFTKAQDNANVASGALSGAVYQEKGTMDDYFKSLIKGYQNGEVETKTFYKALNSMLGNMDKDARKTFVDNLPTDIKDGIKNSKGEMEMLPNLWFTQMSLLLDENKKTFETDIPNQIKGSLDTNQYSNMFTNFKSAWNNTMDNLKKTINVTATTSTSGGSKHAKGAIFYPSKLPKLAVGGIINQPGRGVPYNGAYIGERGAEAVVPLTDSQQMQLLGEAIGKYITVNASITNTMNGRVISRELQRVQNDSDFAFNR